MRLFHRFRPAGSSDQDMTGLVKGEDWEVGERLVTFTEVPNLLTFVGQVMAMEFAGFPHPDEVGVCFT